MSFFGLLLLLSPFFYSAPLGAASFADQVLPSLSNESQYSVFRKRFISHVNEKLGLEFIEVKRSELDKRYRKVVFRHDLL